MRAPTRPARDPRRFLVLGPLLLSLAGCKPASHTAEAPAADLDDIVAIESELAANAQRLEAQGVRLALATESRDEEASGAAKISGDSDEDETDAGRPLPAPPPAEPASEPAPEPAVEEDFEARAAPETRDTAVVGASRADRKAEKRRQRGKKTRCERICDLAEATCTLADRICGLADEHVDDVRYEDACDRAQSQCEAASDACSACED